MEQQGRGCVDHPFTFGGRRFRALAWFRFGGLSARPDGVTVGAILPFVYDDPIALQDPMADNDEGQRAGASLFCCVESTFVRLYWPQEEDTEILPRLQHIRPPRRRTSIRRPPGVG